MLKSYLVLSARWFIPVGLGIVTIISPQSFAASAALDVANNYSIGTFTNGSNGGTGFGAWNFNVGLSSQVVLNDSTLGSGNINSGNGLSFMFYGGTNGSYAEAIRAFNNELAVGDEFSVRFAYNWDGGARGVNLLNSFDGEILNINLGGGNTLSYTFQGQSGVTLSTVYNPTAVVEVVVKQLVGNQLQLTLTRNDGFVTNVVSTSIGAPAAKVKFYNGGHPGDNLNYALFINDLEIVPNPAPVLSLQGKDAMAAGMTNMITISRGGTNQAAITVSLLSSDPGIASVPASVNFNVGAMTTNFLVEGVSFGVATILATTAGYPDASLDVQVYDLGYDDSSYGGGVFTNGGNSGLGFQPWIITNNDGPGAGFTNYAGAFIGDSTAGGSDVNASSGNAFALYANGEGDGFPFINAIRPLNDELAVGEVIALEIGVNFRNGSKGVAFQNSGTAIFEVGVYADDYFYKIGNDAPISLGWDYAFDSAIVVELKRVSGSLYDVTIVREGNTPETSALGVLNLGPTAPNEVRFFNFNTDSGDNANNLYFNRLALYSGYELPVLGLFGNDGMVVGEVNVFTVFRTGPTDNALEVDLESSDLAVATVDPSVEIGIGETSTTFSVVAVSNGISFITGVAVDTVGFSNTLEVVDIAYDDTTYYPPAVFNNGGNGGSGFQPWVISGNDGPGNGFTNFVGAFIGDSSANSGDVNDSTGEAFALYANGDGTGTNAPLAEATRAFTALGIGESISFDMGVNFRNGSKGVMFQSGGTWLFEVAVFNDDYWYNVRDAGDNPISLGWDYASDSAISVVLSRTGANSYNVSLSRVGSSPEDLLVQGVTLSQPPDRVRFYVYDTDSGDANNLYVNDLAIYTGIVGEEVTDGIPNAWWEQYNIPVIDRVATNDYDNDTYSNLDEYIADSNPDDNTSFFLNEILTMSGGNVLHLQTGPTTNSRVYDVWWTTNLRANPQTWTRYGLNVTGNAGGSNVTLHVTNDIPYRIYRTGVALP